MSLLEQLLSLQTYPYIKEEKENSTAQVLPQKELGCYHSRISVCLNKSYNRQFNFTSTEEALLFPFPHEIK